jgi:hypothetical protein
MERAYGPVKVSDGNNCTDTGTVVCIIKPLLPRAGVVQWQYRSFPSFGRGFDSHRPLQ